MGLTRLAQKQQATLELRNDHVNHGSILLCGGFPLKLNTRQIHKDNVAIYSLINQCNQCKYMTLTWYQPLAILYTVFRMTEDGARLGASQVCCIYCICFDKEHANERRKHRDDLISLLLFIYCLIRELEVKREDHCILPSVRLCYVMEQCKAANTRPDFPAEKGFI